MTTANEQSAQVIEQAIEESPACSYLNQILTFYFFRDLRIQDNELDKLIKKISAEDSNQVEILKRLIAIALDSKITFEQLKDHGVLRSAREIASRDDNQEVKRLAAVLISAIASKTKVNEEESVTGLVTSPLKAMIFSEDEGISDVATDELLELAKASESVRKQLRHDNILFQFEQLTFVGATDEIKSKFQQKLDKFFDILQYRKRGQASADKDKEKEKEGVEKKGGEDQIEEEQPETGFYGSDGIYYYFADDWAFDEQGNPCSQKDMDDYEASIEELEDYEADTENQYKHFVWKPKPPQKPISAPTDGTATTENKSAPSTESGAESATTADQTVKPKQGGSSISSKLIQQAAERQNKPVQNQTTGGNQSQINPSLFAAGDAQKQ
ncbi:MAG: hypothetical protein EZS28_005144 [Streblomastix strix]|uniref:Uncharacterized protein n=1 Tax=Streblomastix strix TaxID=222440 RepID=A0A5J4WWL2_9EUKA|nr:MAG: hypothetical protein EZS28_005144 [Streblomastix strix]